MPKYIVRFGAESCVRISQKSYFDGLGHTLKFEDTGLLIVVCDRVVSVGETQLPNGLFIQVTADANTIDEVISLAGSRAVGLANILSFVTGARIERPFPIFAYDATVDLPERDYLSFTYDRHTPRSTRRPGDAEFREFWNK